MPCLVYRTEPQRAKSKRRIVGSCGDGTLTVNGGSAESTLMTQALNDAREVLLLSREADVLWQLEERLRVEREIERIRRDAAEARVRHEREMERIRREREEARVCRERQAEEARVCRERQAEEARVRHEEDRLRREAEIVRMGAERVARGVPRVRPTSAARAAYIEGLFRRHREVSAAFPKPTRNRPSSAPIRAILMLRLGA